MTINKTTYISDSYSKKEIFVDLKGKQNSIIGSEVLPLNVYLNNLVDNTTSEINEFAKICTDIVKYDFGMDFPYQDMLEYPRFVYDFYLITLELIKGNISISDTASSEETKDKKKIIEYIYNQPLHIKKVLDKFNQLTKVENTFVVSNCHENFFDKKIVNTLLEKGAKLYQTEKPQTINYSIKKAVNKTQEVIGLAQYIVANKDNLDLNKMQIMLTDVNSYLPLVIRIFDEYHIPYCSHKNIKSLMSRRFIAYLRFLQTKALPDFFEAFSLNCFENYNSDLVDYCNFLDIDSYQQLLGNLNTISNWDNSLCCLENYRYQRLVEMEQTTKDIMSQIKELDLPFDKSLKEQTIFIYNQLIKQADLKQDTDYLSLKGIEEICSRTVPYITNYEILLFLLENDDIVNFRYNPVGVNITDCYHKPFNKDVVFVLGCTNDIFPKNLGRNGIIDENFLQQINGYPALKERNALLKQQLKEIFANSSNVVFSYPTNTLAGEETVISRFLADYTNKDNISLWQVENNDTRFFNNEEIQPDTAQQLYLNDHCLNGSVTGFQQYAKCPFAYFIERGLRVKDESFNINNATMGTIRHAIMEELFKNNQTNFDATALKYFDSLKQLFVNRQNNVEALYQRLKLTMEEKIKYAQQIYQASDLVPSGFEEKYQYEIGLENGNKIVLTGSIDRVDKNDQYFVVLDYKSSQEATDFNQDDVLSGTHIQIPTYINAYQSKTNLKPLAGSYYVLSRKAIKEDDRKDKEELIKAENRYVTYLVSKDFKDNFPTEHHSFKKQEIDAFLLGILDIVYIELARKMLSGNISIEPYDNACSFCTLNPICHNMKDASNKAPVLVKIQKEDETNE